MTRMMLWSGGAAGTRGTEQGEARTIGGTRSAPMTATVPRTTWSVAKQSGDFGYARSRSDAGGEEYWRLEGAGAKM